MTDSVTIAHLSDLHLTRPDGFSPRHWNVKRGLGYFNWRHGRRSVHRSDVLERLVADMIAQRPDHIAVTGDLVNLGLPSEHGLALRWLERLGPPEKVTVVPGNHDIYVRMRNDPGVARWAPYMAPCAWGRSGFDAGGDGFPFVRRVGPAALIGVNSAVPTPPFVAAGRVGRNQLTRLASALDRVHDAGLVRVVLIHHPPLPGQAPRRRGLADAKQLADVLDAHGADLVLHGHNHTDTKVARRTSQGDMLVLGVASGSAGKRRGAAPLARYNLVRIARGNGVKIDVHARGLLDAGGAIMDLDRRVLVP